MDVNCNHAPKLKDVLVTIITKKKNQSCIQQRDRILLHLIDLIFSTEQHKFLTVVLTNQFLQEDN